MEVKKIVSLKALAKNIPKFQYKMSKSVTLICRSCHGVELMLNKISDQYLFHSNQSIRNQKM